MPKTKITSQVEPQKAPEYKDLVIRMQGQRAFNRTPYWVAIFVNDNKVEKIEITGGRPNLYVEDLCKSFSAMKSQNYRDVHRVIKLAMIQRSEFVTEVEQ